MPKKVIAIFCEGQHDVAFISRILKFNGFISNGSLKISEYPSPINNLFKTEIIKSNLQDINIQNARDILIPSSSIRRDDNFVLLYSLGGDSKKRFRQKLLSEYFELIPKPNEISALPLDVKLSILYFFDADEKGVDLRINELNDEIYEILGIKPFSSHKEVFNYNDLILGSFIFTGDDNNIGKLEDILVPLMKENNEKIFIDAKEYLTNNFEEDRCNKFDEFKSIIGMAGQLQFSGSSNVVCINKSDYINSSKISSNNKCLEIVNFMNNFIDAF